MTYTCQVVSLQPTISALKILKDGVPLQFGEDEDVIVVKVSLQENACRIHDPVMVITKKLFE